MAEFKYTMVAPDGGEYPTDSDQYRTRLLAQGYSEKRTKPPADESATTRPAARSRPPAPAPPRAQGEPAGPVSKPQRGSVTP